MRRWPRLRHSLGVKILLESRKHGADLFREHLAYQDEQIVMRGTGGLLTLLTQSGSGTLAGGAHADTFQAIAQAEAAEISEVFRQQFDAGILAAVTPGEAAFAYFELAANEETDTAAIVKDVASLVTAGYRVKAEWVAVKTGYELEEKALSTKHEILNRRQAQDFKTQEKKSGRRGWMRWRRICSHWAGRWKGQ